MAKDEKHFEDTGMNPGSKKDLPKEPTKKDVERQKDAISKNVRGKK